jgi:hypothetical protein
VTVDGVIAELLSITLGRQLYLPICPLHGDAKIVDDDKRVICFKDDRSVERAPGGWNDVLVVGDHRASLHVSMTDDDAASWAIVEHAGALGEIAARGAQRGEVGG